MVLDMHLELLLITKDNLVDLGVDLDPIILREVLHKHHLLEVELDMEMLEVM